MDKPWTIRTQTLTIPSVTLESSHRLERRHPYEEDERAVDRLTFNQHLADNARRIADDLADNLGQNRDESSDSENTLEIIVRLPIDLIDNCSLTGISVIRHQQGNATSHQGPHGSIDTPSASHPDVHHIDELQHKLTEGPLLVLRHDDTVISRNVETDDRWPRWGAQVADQYRVRSAMAFRLFTDGRTLAALSLYSEKPDAFTGDDMVDALALVGQTGITLAAALELDHMHAALRSRHVIGQAVGMVRERFTLTEEQAINVLKRLSSQQNIKLVHVAKQVVETGDLPQPLH